MPILLFLKRTGIVYITGLRKNTQKIFRKHAFFISKTFVSNASLRLAKSQANAKQDPEDESLRFENYSHSSFTLSSKNNRTTAYYICTV